MVLFVFLTVQACYSDTPYWVTTENERFLNDTAGLKDFKLSYFSVELRFQEEQRHLVAEKKYGIDESGNVAEVTETDIDDSTTMDTVYTYDDKGRLVEEQLVLPNGVHFTLHSYEYVGNSRTRKSFAVYGLDSQEKDVFDALGRTVESTDFDADGKVTNSFHYKYEDAKQTTDWYGPDGKLVNRTIEYVSSGKPTKREDYYGGKLSLTILYRYNKSGELSGEIGQDQSAKNKFRYEYTYEKGKLTQEKRMLSADEEILVLYDYDDKGRLTRLTHSNKVNKFGKEYYETEYIIERTVNSDNGAE
jgi:hypothetical protein